MAAGSALLNWLGRLTAYGWVDLGIDVLTVLLLVLVIALIWDGERLVKRHVQADKRRAAADDRVVEVERRLGAVEDELDPPGDSGRHAGAHAATIPRPRSTSGGSRPGAGGPLPPSPAQ